MSKLARQIIDELLEDLSDQDVVDDYSHWLVSRGGTAPTKSNFAAWLGHNHEELVGREDELWDLLQGHEMAVSQAA